MIDENRLIKKLERLQKIVFTYNFNVAHVCDNLLCEIKDFINEQPKINEWIPVEERLPEIFENVLIYTKSGHYHIGAYFEERKRWWLGVYWEDLDFILAWMPLPKPYEVKE